MDPCQRRRGSSVGLALPGVGTFVFFPTSYFPNRLDRWCCSGTMDSAVENTFPGSRS